jgi:hypothetical protein
MPIKLSPGDAVVLATREGSRVFGYLVARDAVERFTLRRSRVAVFYSRATHGYGGLGALGPPKDSRVGPPVDGEYGDVRHVLRVSEQAVERWEAEPWAE